MRRLLLILALLVCGQAFGAVKYIDLGAGTDGTSGTVHDGEMEATRTAGTGTDANEVYIATGTMTNGTDDDYNGDYLVNVTRGAGQHITDHDADNGSSFTVLTLAGDITGQVATDQFYVIRAWKTIEKYTTTTVRTAGDIAYVRANTTETVGAASILLDEYGTIAAQISVIGCDAIANDPWNDDSSVRPVLDFGGQAYGITGNGSFWTFTNMRFLNSHRTSGAFSFSQRYGYIFNNCVFEDNYYYAITSSIYGTASVIGCTFTNNGEASIAAGDIYLEYSGSIALYNSDFDPFGTDRKIINTAYAGRVYAEGCNFSGAAYFYYGYRTADNVRIYNCTFTDITTPVLVPHPAGRAFSDGWDFGAGLLDKGHQWIFTTAGQVNSDSSWARPGGAPSGWSFESGANCGLNAPLTLEYNVYAADTAAHDYTLYALFEEDDPFAGNLSEATLYFTVQEYKGDGTTATSAMGAKTWTYNDYVNWQSATISHTAAAAGMLKITVSLAYASGIVYIDLPGSNSASWYANGSQHWSNLLGPWAAAGDVQSGVDRGDGTTGTLTLPTEAQTEAGVTYGADGTEFKGTLSVSGGSGMPRIGRGLIE